jgi:hypothetical protein
VTLPPEPSVATTPREDKEEDDRRRHDAIAAGASSPRRRPVPRHRRSRAALHCFTSSRLRLTTASFPASPTRTGRLPLPAFLFSVLPTCAFAVDEPTVVKP